MTDTRTYLTRMILFLVVVGARILKSGYDAFLR